MTLQRRILSSPIGGLIALASADALCSLAFDDPGRRSRLRARLDRWYAPYRIAEARSGEKSAGASATSSERILQATERWLSTYFAGHPAAPTDPPLDARGTAFERQVWHALRQVDWGTTSTYGSIAASIGRPSASRAVGLANGNNPLAIIVPCHRIIGSDGSLTGYGGGLDRKRWLLRHESAEAVPRLF